MKPILFIYFFTTTTIYAYSQQVLHYNNDSIHVNLNEITIVAKRNNVKMNIDRYIYDITTNPMSKNNTLQALKYIPMVKCDGDEFSIIGKDNTVVYINSRKSRLTGQNLTSYLKTLSAERIKSVEIITTPNSAFEGEGDFGVLNIILKRNENEGVNSTFSGSVRKTHYFKEDADWNMDYQSGRVSGNILIGACWASDWQNKTIENLYKQTLLSTSTHSLTDTKYQNYSSGIILDYKLNTKTTLGIISALSLYKEKRTERGEALYGKYGTELNDSILGLDYASRTYKPEVSQNINLRTEFSGNSKLNIDFDYLNHYDRERSEKIMNRIDENGTVLSLYDRYFQSTPQKTNIWSAKIDYNFEGEHFALNTGVDGYYSNIDNDDKYLLYRSSSYVNDSTQSNHFVLHEWTACGYVSYQQSWNKRLVTNIGFRLERTNYRGKQRTANSDFENNYWNFLPTIFIGYRTDNAGRLNYNLSYRVSRPDFESLNPFIVYTSPSTYSKGNPYLMPQKYISQNLNWGYKQYYLKFSYLVMKDVISGVSLIKGNNMIERVPLNLNKMQKLSVILGTNTNYLNNRASLNLTAMYNWISYGGSAESMNMGYMYNSASVNINNYITLSEKHKWALDCGLNFSSKEKYNRIERPYHLKWNIELHKDYKQTQISLFHFQNLYFYNNKTTSNWKLVYDADNLNTITYMKGESWGIGIRFTYHFGNNKVQKKEIRDTSNSEIKSRVN